MKVFFTFDHFWGCILNSRLLEELFLDQIMKIQNYFYRNMFYQIDISYQLTLKCLKHFLWSKYIDLNTRLIFIWTWSISWLSKRPLKFRYHEKSWNLFCCWCQEKPKLQNWTDGVKSPKFISWCHHYRFFSLNFLKKKCNCQFDFFCFHLDKKWWWEKKCWSN